MDKCPRCSCYELVYYPQSQANVCGACGFTKPEKYEHYIKRKDCSKDLLYPLSLCVDSTKKEKP
jgi:hypothetical protein